MKKFRIFLSLKKEEEWINSIQEEGYKLVSVNSAVPMCVWQNKSAELCKGKMQSPALNFCA